MSFYYLILIRTYKCSKLPAENSLVKILSLNIKQMLTDITSLYSRTMEDDLGSSSDESFSYKDSGKKALEKAKKKIADVNMLTISSDVGGFPSISEYNDVDFVNESLVNEETSTMSKTRATGNSIVREKLPTRRKRKGLGHSIVNDKLWTPPKRTGLENNIREKSPTRLQRIVMENTPVRRSKRLRSARPKVAGSLAQSVAVFNLDYIDNESMEDDVRFHRGNSLARLTSTQGNDVECIDILSSDGIEDMANSEQQAVSVLSDSSDVEVLTPPGSAHVSNDCPGSDANEVMTIKISWKLQPIQKFQLRRHQKFKTLMEHFSKIEDVPLNKIIIIYRGNNKHHLIEPCDTPDTVGITITDVLEGGVLSQDREGRAQRSRGLAREEEGNGIRVRVQVEEGARSFPLMIGHQQKMRVLLIKVAEQLEVDVSKVRLSLDGEVIDNDLTPEKLDLEEGDVLDVHLL